jgi:hypothetical protein
LILILLPCRGISGCKSHFFLWTRRDRCKCRAGSGSTIMGYGITSDYDVQASLMIILPMPVFYKFKLT